MPTAQKEQTIERLDNPAARKGAAQELARSAIGGGTDGEEDETQTTQMSAELRARIDQLMAPPSPPPLTPPARKK